MSDNYLFWRVFSRRTLITYFVVTVLFLTCILRVAVTAISDYSEIQEKQNNLKLKTIHITFGYKIRLFKAVM